MFAPFHLTLLLAATAPDSSALERCKKDILEDPNNYERVICFNHLPFKRPLELLDELERKRPEGRYFDLLRGNLNWRINPSEAPENYRAAAQTLREGGDYHGAILAHSNASQVLLWKLERPEQARIENEKVRELYEAAHDPKAKRRGKIQWALFAADTDTQIGQAYELLRSIPEVEIETMRFHEKRDFLRARARLSGFMLRFREARIDFKELERIARNEGPSARRYEAFAMIDAQDLNLRRLRLNPQELERERDELERELRRIHDFALENGRTDYAAIALDFLSTILAADPDRHTDALDAAERCLALTEGHERVLAHYALCLASKSHLLETSNPQKSLAQAQKALDLLSNSGHGEFRLRAWRNLMRRAWAALPRDKAIEIARSALDRMEELRSTHKNRTARQLMFTVWTEDYYWLSSRLFKSSRQDPSYLPMAFSTLEQSRARVLLEYMPKPSGLEQSGKSDRVTSIEALQAQLDPEEAMLVYQIANKRSLEGDDIGGSWLLLITKQWSKALPLELERTELNTTVTIIRDMAKSGAPAIQSALKKLRAELLAPATKLLPKTIRELVIIADGPIHALPFFSIDSKYRYSLAPSASIWSRARAGRPPSAPEASGLSLVDPQRSAEGSEKGDPSPWNIRNAEIDTSLPLAEGRREAAAIQNSLSSKVLTLAGASATPQALLERWGSGNNFLHISAHAQVNTEAPEQSQILLSNLDKVEGGNLKVSEIYNMDLRSDVVVLAGCSTGWGSWIAGEGILSIARAFQLAGASAVVASLWPIRDGEAADFFELFYKHLGKGAHIAKALSLAQKEMRGLDYPPRAYEGYVVIGDGKIRFDPRPSAWQGLLWWLLAAPPLGLVLWMRKK